VRRENGGNAISVFESRKPYVSNNPLEDSRIIRSLLELFPAKNLASVPLVANGRCIGVLHLNNKPGGYTEEDLAVLDWVGSQLAMAVETARLVQRCKRQEAQVWPTLQQLKRVAELDQLVVRAALRGGVRAITECLGSHLNTGVAFYDRRLVRRASARVADETLTQLDQYLSQVFGRKDVFSGCAALLPLSDRLSVFPLHAEGEVLGYLCVLDDSGSQSERAALIDRTLPILTLELLREQGRGETLRDAESDLLADLVSGRHSPQEIADRARKLGLALPLPGVVLIARCTGTGAQAPSVSKRLRQRSHELKSRLEERGLRGLTAVSDGEVVFLLSLPAGRQGWTLKGVAAELRAGLDCDQDLTVYLGVGGVAQGPAEVSRSWREARFALDSSVRLGRQEKEVFFEELGLYRPLAEAEVAAELERLVQGLLGPLIATDRKKGTSYLKTLYSYFEHGGNLRLTAADLVCHLNTVRYRLDRVARLLGTGLEHPEFRFNLELGVRFARFFYPELFR
jgi:sugar diacid utilization regulator